MEGGPALVAGFQLSSAIEGSELTREFVQASKTSQRFFHVRLELALQIHLNGWWMLIQNGSEHSCPRDRVRDVVRHLGRLLK